MKKSEFVTIIIALLVIAALIGCSKDSPVVPEEKDPIAVNKALATRHLTEVWNQGKLNVLDEIATADFVFHFGSQDISGTAAYKQFITIHRTAFPDLNFTIDEQVAESNMVGTRYTTTGTHKGELSGIPPTNIQTTMTGIGITRIDNNKLAEAWVYDDQAGLLIQLGVLPEMGMEYTWSEPLPPGNNTGDLEKNKTLVTRVPEWFNSGDTTIAHDIFAENLVNHFPNFPSAANLEGIKQFCAVSRMEWPNFHVTIDEMIAEGNFVLVHWTATGTHQGGVIFPPTGKQVAWRGITIWRVAGDKIVEGWWSQDMYGLLVQLGIVPPPSG
ncbi:MAG: ester cyclase [Bacteroidota bacterium]|nr:ester cyclase [Bacteroidota bacterium]